MSAPRFGSPARAGSHSIEFERRERRPALAERCDFPVEVFVSIAHTVKTNQPGDSLPGYHQTIRDADFERLYDEHAQSLFRFLSYRTGDPALSEDLLADTFEKVLRARARARLWPVRSAEKQWLYAIALNCLRDGARRRAVEERALERVAAEPNAWADEAGDPLAAVGRRDQVQRALASLGDDEREALALRFGADLTVPEIARILRVPLTTAEGRVYRGLRKLRDVLG